MPVLGAILGVLKALPQLLEMIKKAAIFTVEWIGNYERDKASKELAEAVQKAQEKKDTRAIEDTFRN